MKLKRNFKKLMAVICIMALTVTSITFSNSQTTKADGSATVNGRTYTVTDGPQGDWTGITCQGIFDNARIHFAWGKKVKPDLIRVMVAGEYVAVDNTSAYGCSITLADVDTAIAEAAQHGLPVRDLIDIDALTDEETPEHVYWTAELIVEEAAETTTRDPSVFEWKDIAGSTNLKYDDRTNTKVVSYQKPAWPNLEKSGVYVEPPQGAGAPSSLTINGVTTGINGDGDYGTFYVNGAGLLFYDDAFTTSETTIEVKYAPDVTGTLVIKNTDATEVTTAEETTEELTTAEETTEEVTTAEETTEEVTTAEETTEATQLNPPEGLTFSHEEDGVYYFTWQSVEGADGYSIYLNGEWVYDAIDTTYGFTEDDFDGSGTYTIQVSAWKDDVESDKASTDYEYVEPEEPTTEEVEPTTAEETSEEVTTAEETTEEITTEEITTEEITTEEPTTEAPTKPSYNYDEMVSGDTNLALKATAKDVGTHREGTVAQLNDGVIDKWGNYDAITVNAEHPSGAFDIALDKAYAASSIDQVAIWWRTADVQFVPQQGYKVQFGYNGVFTTVATVTKADYPTEGTTGGWVDEARFVTDTDFTNARVEGNVDTIRILIDTSVEWGAQVREIGVFASDPQEPEALPQADAPAGITASSPDYGMIAYTITAGENQDDYTYNVYDGETLIGENVEAGTEYVVSGIASGMHTLKAVSVVPGYEPSEAVYSDEFAVEDIADLFGTTLNISTLATVASVSSFYNENYSLDTAGVAIDGVPTPGEGANACIRTGANTDAEIVIELDKDYYVKGLKKVLLAYTNPRTYAANTKISVSADGENYTELTSTSGYKATKDGAININAIDLPASESTDTFKYVKVSLSAGERGWGYVLNEIGIIYNNTNNIPAVEGLVNVPGAEGEISYEFAWNADADAIEYNVYVDGKYTTTVLDSTVDLESVLSKAKPGRHVISVKAVAEDGSESVNAASVEFDIPEPPTESTTEAPSTEAPSTEAPTQAPGTITDLDISIAAQGEKDPTQKVGGYDIYAGSWNNSTAVAGVDPEDADHIKIAAKSSNWSDAWGLQVQKNIAGLDPKTAYTYEIAIKSDNNDGKVKITGSNAEIPVTGAAQTLAGTVETDEDGHAMVAIGMGWVGLNNGIEVYSVTLKDADGNIVYPGGDEPTTEAPTGDVTTEAPTGDVTTEAPTGDTTQAPTGDTTVAPTGDTTVAPTQAPTTAKKIAKPGKTKIKKVFKKKKSAKKLKIKVKKAKGANGYQVAVFKTKKNAKKNKAFFKKYFKKNKATFTITHKKLKKIKKTFYVKVRAYNKDANGKIQYSSWTKAKKAKVK